MTTDGELVRRVLAGDKQSFAALVQRYQKDVYNLAYRSVNDFQEAEDIAQETFLRAYRSLARWDAGRPFRPWLYAIAVNVCRDRARRAARRPRTVPLLDSDVSGGADIAGAAAPRTGTAAPRTGTAAPRTGAAAPRAGAAAPRAGTAASRSGSVAGTFGKGAHRSEPRPVDAESFAGRGNRSDVRGPTGDTGAHGAGGLGGPGSAFGPAREPPPSPVVDAILRRERDEAIQKAVMDLDLDYRLPVVLFYMRGVPQKEIAEIMRVPLSVVKNRLYRARRRLQAELQPLLDDETGTEEGRRGG